MKISALQASLLVLAAATTSTLRAQGVANSFVLQDVQIIDGTGNPPVAHQTIVIQNGKISRIVPARGAAAVAGAPVIHLSGKTVMPGLINGHGHVGLVDGASGGGSHYTGLNIMRQLVQYENYGVTTMISLGMNKDLGYQLRSEQEKGNEPGATLLTAGRGIGIPNGVPGFKVGKDQLYRPANPEEARAAVREMATHSPNLIKIWVDDDRGKSPKPNPAVDAAVIDEAHRLNLRVAAHVYALADAKRLLKDGVDILAHSVRDTELDADTVSLIKNNKTYYIPTLQLEDSFYCFADQPALLQSPFLHGWIDPKLEAELGSAGYREKTQKDPSTAAHRKALQIAEANVKKLKTATAAVAFGTDSGAFPNRIPGWAEHRELELMVDSGMTPLEAIHSATQVNAEMLKIAEKTGTIQVGKQADLIVLDVDPSTDISNTQKINAIFHNGRRVDREKK